MRKFELYIVASGERKSKPVVVDGFIEAEEKAKELLEKTYKYYPCDDTYIECVIGEFDLSFDHFIMVKESDGNASWRVLKMGDYGPLCIDWPDDVDIHQLEGWRYEQERHIENLTSDELKELYTQVSFGSIYTSDFENSFFIDANEVMIVCEDYEFWVECNKLNDTPELFANYVLDVFS